MNRFLFNCFISIFVLHIVNNCYGDSSPDSVPDTPEAPKFAQCKIKEADLKLLQKGDKGDKGADGLVGKEGPQGPKGDKGDIGPQGPAGINGKDGAKGVKGENGVSGLPGPRGEDGQCACNKNDDTGVVDGADGSEDKPFQNMCKHSADIVKENSIYFMKPEGLNRFKVTCEKSKTCINPVEKEAIKIFNIKYQKERKEAYYWLSIDPEWTMENIYGISTDVLLWLQHHSDSVQQKIKYHCLNSVPINSDRNKSLKLLTWNDVLVGPDRSETTSFYYSVENDGCKDSAEKKTEWLSTELEISSKIPIVLPVKDIQINDNRGEDAQIKIEVMKLCFH